MNEKIIEIGDYGMYITSPDRLVSFLKTQKMGSKKILAFFQKDHDVYIESLKEGVWLPILPIDSVEYHLKFNEGYDENWKKVVEEEGFNIEVGDDNSLYIGSLSNLHNWNKNDFTATKDFNSYQTLDGETLFGSFRFEIKKGKYLVKLKGYKRIKPLEYPEVNYGFSFELIEVDKFKGFKDSREDEKYSFNIAQL